MISNRLNANFRNVYYEENKGDEGEGGAGSANQEVDMAELMERLKAENEALKAKNNEVILKMQKTAEAKREAEERARLEAEEKARKAGDFEQLFKSQEQKTQEYEQKLRELQNSIAQKEVQSQAMRIANELADGPNAELLSEFVARRLRYTDNGIKIIDNNGQLTVSSIDDLKAEFGSSSRYAALLRGTKASGGAATGGRGDASAPKVMNRAEFDALAPLQKSKFVQDKGQVID